MLSGLASTAKGLRCSCLNGQTVLMWATLSPHLGSWGAAIIAALVPVAPSLTTAAFGRAPSHGPVQDCKGQGGKRANVAPGRQPARARGFDKPFAEVFECCESGGFYLASVAL